MPHLVKVLIDDDGIKTDNPVWHLCSPIPAGVWGQVFCTGEVFGLGESSVEYEIKETKRGGIECATCLKLLRAYKAVRL